MVTLNEINWKKLINEFLAEKHLSQFKFAIMLGCSLPTVSRWCRGVNKPDREMQAKIVEVIKAK